MRRTADWTWVRNRAKHALRAAAEQVNANEDAMRRRACVQIHARAWNDVCVLCAMWGGGGTWQGIMGAELRDVPGKFSFRDATEYRWDPAQTCNGATECPQLPGLYSFRGFLSKDETGAIANMAGVSGTFLHACMQAYPRNLSADAPNDDLACTLTLSLSGWHTHTLIAHTPRSSLQQQDLRRERYALANAVAMV